MPKRFTLSHELMIMLHDHPYRAGRISRYTRSHSKNATLGKCLFLGIDTKFGFKSIELAEMELYF
jgi:hypothetical protein